MTLILTFIERTHDSNNFKAYGLSGRGERLAVPESHGHIPQTLGQACGQGEGIERICVGINLHGLCCCGSQTVHRTLKSSICAQIKKDSLVAIGKDIDQQVSGRLLHAGRCGK